MKNILALTIILVLTLNFASCEKEIEFKGEIVEPMIVMNSYLTPDSVVSVHLTKSRFFLSSKNGFDTITNAVVSVFVNDVFKEKLPHLRSGYYRGTYIPKIGEAIRMLVEVPGIEKNTESTAIIQPASMILSVDTIQYINYTDTFYNEDKVMVGYYIGKNCEVKLKIRDRADMQNYYRMVVSKKSYSPIEPDQIRSNYFITFKLEGMDNQSGNPLDFFGDSESYNDEHLFTDEIFNGKDFVLRFLTDFGINYYDFELGNKFNPESIEEMTINLQTISKDMYLYLKSKQVADNIVDGLFAEPVQIFNNITNGIGILGSQTNNEYNLILK